MSQSARVSSIDAIKALHAALARFGPEAQEALAAAEIEIRRVFDYLNDQLKYWQRQCERRRENVNRARSDLSHVRTLHKGERSGAVEQEIALRKAQALLQEAEEKVIVVKRWLVHLPQAVNEYEGPARRLAGMLDSDHKQGVAILESKIAILDAYTTLTAPHVSSGTSAPRTAPAASAPPSPPPPQGEQT